MSNIVERRGGPAKVLEVDVPALERTVDVLTDLMSVEAYLLCEQAAKALDRSDLSYVVLQLAENLAEQSQAATFVARVLEAIKEACDMLSQEAVA